MKPVQASQRRAVGRQQDLDLQGEIQKAVVGHSMLSQAAGNPQELDLQGET